MPEFIEIDGALLAEAGSVVTVADLVAPQGVTILSDPAQQLVSAVEPAALAAANDAAGGSDEEVIAEEGAETTESAPAEAANTAS